MDRAFCARRLIARFHSAADSPGGFVLHAQRLRLNPMQVDLQHIAKGTPGFPAPIWRTCLTRAIQLPAIVAPDNHADLYGGSHKINWAGNSRALRPATSALSIMKRACADAFHRRRHDKTHKVTIIP